jgi:hypothetical protein
VTATIAGFTRRLPVKKIKTLPAMLPMPPDILTSVDGHRLIAPEECQAFRQGGEENELCWCCGKQRV